MALKFIVNILLPSRQVPSRICFLVDSIVAINFSTLAWIPTSNFSICREIHSLVSSCFQRGNKVKFFWAPGHEGIPENEAADKLAERAGSKVKGTSPVRAQPCIPFSVSRGLAKSAVWQQLQENWLRSLPVHEGTDHLTNVQLGVRVMSRFFVGDRTTQTTLARLRFGHSDLAAHRAKTYDTVSSMCECGTDEETTRHFLLYCKRFDSERYPLMHTLASILPEGTSITTNVLLGGQEFVGSDVGYKQIAKAVALFVQRTRRFQ